MLFSLTVGKVDAGVAVLLTDDNRIIEFPTILLPDNIASGSIVDIRVGHNTQAQAAAEMKFANQQTHILQTFGVIGPAAPVLRCRNVTQTSVVLEWEPIMLATADLNSLTLFRNGSKTGTIPRPLEMTTTKISGLAVETEYTFHLVLRTTAGNFRSADLVVRTHKMTDLSGVRITAGPMPADVRDEVATTAGRLGAQLVDGVRIDTTHFLCTEGSGPGWKNAQDLNIPVVHPEWLRECDRQNRIVGVRNFYLESWRPSDRDRAGSGLNSGPASARSVGGQAGRPGQGRGGHAIGQSEDGGISGSGTPTATSPGSSALRLPTRRNQSQAMTHTSTLSNVTRMSDFAARGSDGGDVDPDRDRDVTDGTGDEGGRNGRVSTSTVSSTQPNSNVQSQQPLPRLSSTSDGVRDRAESSSGLGTPHLGNGTASTLVPAIDITPSDEPSGREAVRHGREASLSGLAYSPPESPMDGSFERPTSSGAAATTTAGLGARVDSDESEDEDGRDVAGDRFSEVSLQ